MSGFNKGHAKQMSMRKWNNVLKDLKTTGKIKIGSFSGSARQPDEKVYGKCGFCKLKYERSGGQCSTFCVLYPETCTFVRVNMPEPALYWQICDQIKLYESTQTPENKFLLQNMIELMIKVIKEA